MIKKILVLLVVCACSLLVQARDDHQTVFLKNGSVINGNILELIPNETVKIATNDGNVFVFEMNEVDRIERADNRQVVADDNTPQRRLNRGYKGMLDLGYGIGVGDNDYGTLSVSTSHGYQINPIFFVGAGVGLDARAYKFRDTDRHDTAEISVPMYAHMRASFIKMRVTPFVDTKLGYSVGDISGAYCGLGVGVRFAMTPKIGLNLSTGATFQSVRDSWNDENLYDTYIKFTFDF